MLSLFIEIRMAPLKLLTILNNVVTFLMCTSCSVQAANAIFMVSFLMYCITRKHISLILCVCMFYVQKCWTNVDDVFYEYCAMRSDSILISFNRLLVGWFPTTGAG
jgi:hypothetical protein